MEFIGEWGLGHLLYSLCFSAVLVVLGMICQVLAFCIWLVRICGYGMKTLMDIPLTAALGVWHFGYLGYLTSK